MTITGVNKVAASAVKSLRVKSLLDEVPKTEIARKTGDNRVTVAKRLKGNDMPLSSFIGISDALGADPVDVLQKAIRRHQPRK